MHFELYQNVRRLGRSLRHVWGQAGAVSIPGTVAGRTAASGRGTCLRVPPLARPPCSGSSASRRPPCFQPAPPRGPWRQAWPLLLGRTWVGQGPSPGGAAGPGPSSAQQAGTSDGIWKGATRFEVKGMLVSPSLLYSLLVIFSFPD